VLIKKAAGLLAVETPYVEKAIAELIQREQLMQEGDDILYLPQYYHAERGIVKQLLAINSLEVQKPKNLSDLIIKTQKLFGIEYDKTQLTAIYTALGSKVSVLTGGPGVGKTTITRAILGVLQALGKEVLLAAPTGRAAKRLGEACSCEAKTIHRLLEASPQVGFARNENVKLEGDALIVDESSMIDLFLMYNLIKAVPNHMQIIFIGDADQLPSVGPGNVLNNLISSKVVPVTRLTQIYRQSSQSQIIVNAHRINQGESPDISNPSSGDFFFLVEPDSNKAAETIRDLVCFRLPSTYHLDSKQSIQVLSPMKKGPVGTDALNGILQNALNPSGAAIRKGGVEFRLGDKVMQLKNNYNSLVFNGDIGMIIQMDVIKETLIVSYDDHRLVEYGRTGLDELTLSYAVTIHKSQGGEFDAVVIPICRHHSIMLERNLLYTGVTRARRLVVLIGEKEALQRCVATTSSKHRNSLLDKRLKLAFSQISR
jgi:exodeoxyribonuclease V alpha subunit